MNKKILSLGLTLSLSFSVLAQNAGTHIWRATPLLTGYNVQIPSNAVAGPQMLTASGTTAVVTSTNLLFTTYRGQIVYSYSNNANGGLGTNGFIADAFSPGVSLAADANADINANASLWLVLNNTNYLPIVATNSQGQFVVPGTGTNGLYPVFGGPNPTVWPFNVQGGPNWLGPATTNFYSGFPTSGPGTTTNQFFVNLYTEPDSKIQGGLGQDLNPTIPMWESAPSFTAAFTLTGASVPQILSTNLPVGFLQHAHLVAITVGFTNATYTLGTNIQNALLNQAFIVQPQ